MFEVKNSTICKSLFFGSNLMPVGPCQKEELKMKIGSENCGNSQSVILIDTQIEAKPLIASVWRVFSLIRDEVCSVHIWSQEAEPVIPSRQSRTGFLDTFPSTMQQPIITNVPKAYITNGCEPPDNQLTEKDHRLLKDKVGFLMPF